LALGAGATYVARTIDRETKHMQGMISRSYEHKGTSFLEIYQNCNIFNDGAFGPMTGKESKADSVLWLENGQPMVFGKEKNRGIRLDGNTPMIVEIGDKWSLDDVLVHNESDYVIASFLSNLTYQSDFPDPIGVLYAIDSPTYEDLMMAQINEAIKKSDKKSVQDILNSGDTWVVE
jgi:2-oxoglutarate ferredoxin oxidoreductase subunit beta